MFHPGQIRMSLRTAIVLVAVLALWTARQVDKARAQRDTVDAILREGGHVGYDDEYTDGKHLLKRKPRGPAWLRRTLGDDYFQRVEVVYLVGLSMTDAERSEEATAIATDAALARLAALDPFRKLVIDSPATSQGLRHISDLIGLEELTLFTGFEVRDALINSLKRLHSLKKLRVAFGDHLTDAALRDLAQLPRLEEIVIGRNQFTDRGLAYLGVTGHFKLLKLGSGQYTDAGLAHLRGLNNLKVLSLESDLITDAGLERLSGLTHLESLCLRQSRVTDLGLVHLERLTNLKDLDLRGSRVTTEGLPRLRSLRKLERIELSATEVTPEEADKFRRSAPELKGCKWYVGLQSGCIAVPLK